MIKCDHNLIKRMKFNFFDIFGDIKCIIGMNGLIWVYYSTVKIESDYFTDDQNQVNQFDKHEVNNNNNYNYNIRLQL